MQQLFYLFNTSKPQIFRIVKDIGTELFISTDSEFGAA